LWLLTLSETHVKESENIDDIYKISGYNFESRKRSNGIGGGVAVYVHEDVNYIRRFDLESSDLENIVIEIVLNKSTNIIIATHYRPPNSSKYLLKTFSESFEKSLSFYCRESKEVILLGDMNVDYLIRKDNADIKSIIVQNGLTQIIKEPTRTTSESKTLIDIIATNKPENIISSDVINTNLSDHDLVACIRKINTKKFPKKTVTCRNYKFYDPNQMKSDFDKVNWIPVLTGVDNRKH